MKYKPEREKLISCINCKCKMNDSDYDESCRNDKSIDKCDKYKPIVLIGEQEVRG
jgi:hypothetical protein